MAGTTVLMGTSGGAAQAVTATPTPTQATAAPITGTVANVTSAAAANGILLQPSGAGQTVYLNVGANGCVVYPPVGGALNGGTVNASVSLTASKLAIVVYSDVLNATIVQLA